MNRYLAICAVSLPLLFARPVPVRAALVLTNNTTATTWSDSFGRAGYGQRQNFFIGSYLINYFPQYFVSYRDHSRSGAGNSEMLTSRMPKYGIADAGANRGVTNALNFFYVSGNGGLGSNSMYGLFKEILQFPTNSYTTNTALGLTNDWPQANAASIYSSIVIGDVIYTSLSTDSRNYSYGARSAAIEDGVPFVDTWSNLVDVVTDNSDDSSTLWNAPAFDHPNNTLYLIWALTTLQSLGVDTNTFTAIIDANAMTVSSTNHCTVSSLSGSSTSFTFTFHADRMAPGFYVPNGIVTNDCRPAFELMPQLGNAFCEIWRITNLPAGNYSITWGGHTVIATSTQLAAGYNWFTNYSNPLWDQKTEVLYGMCDMLDVLRSTASDDAHPGDNRFIERFESGANTLWATNPPSVTDYISKMVDSPAGAGNTPPYALEDVLFQQDVVIHASAQQTNIPVTISLITHRFAPFHR